MRLRFIQHVPFEGPGNIAAWAKERGYAVTGTHPYKGDALPDIEDFDFLAVMGGPMNVHEEGKHPWLAAEKELLREAVKSEKAVIGVCLGAQLLSEALGGSVAENGHREIGWHRTRLTSEGRHSRVFAGFPAEFIPLHWHADTFTIPRGFTCAAESAACKNQAFEGEDGRVAGLQFHLEYSQDDVRTMLRECADGMVPGKYVGTPYGILANAWRTNETKRLLFLLLDNMAEGL